MDPKKKKKDEDIKIPAHNPADEGVDHNAREGGEKDLQNSYLDKQESHGGRGVDNEDSTEDLSDDDSAS
jgi:hypothetical protein